MPSNPIVLDSWGVVAYFLGQQPAADRLKRLLFDAFDRHTPLLMAAVNLGEVWYSVARAGSEDEADRVVLQTADLAEIVEADWPLARQAARFKAKGGLSYADCFALALAKSRNARLATGDSEFKPFESAVKILWL